MEQKNAAHQKATVAHLQIFYMGKVQITVHFDISSRTVSNLKLNARTVDKLKISSTHDTVLCIMHRIIDTEFRKKINDTGI